MELKPKSSSKISDDFIYVLVSVSPDRDETLISSSNNMNVIYAYQDMLNEIVAAIKRASSDVVDTTTEVTIGKTKLILDSKYVNDITFKVKKINKL